ncbi:Increased DNA methylation 1 [Camellia lanceoleosa]|uniref:Increased DNA methylation 1 n=1 Tax=Camellia lanceoleosa TaxID=1840588 RepID=A0ACC0GRF3_9ERIC|nr:Increased DNA methylation 1 [Camellia lanceoleosa]
MEDGVRSSGGLVKKKSSSGCLIIKKKADGTSGVGVSGSRKDFQLNKEIKRSRFDFSDSESIDELLEPVRRKVVYGTDRFRNGSAVNSENLVEDSKFGQNGEIGSERKRRLDAREFYDYDGIDGKRMRKDYLQSRFTIAGRSGSEREFETGSIRHVMMDKRSEREFETGSSKHVMIDKRKHSYFDSASNSSAGRKDVPDYTVKSRFGIEDGEAHLPVSSLRREFHVSSDETIRLQGKNGVLKVMVNKKKKMEELPHKFCDRRLEVESRKGSISENAIKKNTFVGPSLYSCSKRHEKETSVGPSFYLGSKCHEKNSSVGPSFSLDSKHPEKNTSVKPSFYSDSKCPEKAISFVKTEKSELKLRKPLSVISKAGNSETEDSDTLLRLGPSVQARSSSKGVKSEGKAPSAEKITPDRGEEGKVKRGYGKEKQLLRDTSLSLGPSVQGCGSLKRVKKSEGKAPSAEKIMPDTGKEGKVKRGYGTEKQLLREKIRAMLVSAGWTIDYRPRRNRDYLDAVYINPTGTAYWSIIKAYEALQKQLEEENAEIKPTGHSLQFTALPEEVVSKLTRQTRKKVEKEMKRKRKDHGRSKTVKGVSMEEFAEGTVGDKDDKKLNFVMKQNGKSPKGRSHETTCVSGDNSSGALYKGSSKQVRAEKPSTATNSHMIQARKSRKIGRCTLLVRSSDKKLNSESDSYVPYTGKRTLLSWLIDSGMVHLSEKVQYMNRERTRVKLKGWISRDGIHCGCCSKILTVSKFEIHAGSKLRQPFQNIYVESGVSLLQRQIDAWNKQEESERCGFHPVDVDGDPNDDTCGLCGDGGDLICCDGCPSTFHQSCLDIQMLPAGDWHCPNCTCKFCGIAGLINAHRNGTNVGVLLTCGLCEKKYHESCSKEKDALPDDSNCLSTSFCGQKCRELFDHLEKLLGVRHELEAGFSWSIVHRTDLDTDASDHGFPQRVECNSKLAVALSVMDECFLPIVDRRSGINLIHNVLYNCGSNFSRLNYSGFYTAILRGVMKSFLQHPSGSTGPN